MEQSKIVTSKCFHGLVDVVHHNGDRQEALRLEHQGIGLHEINFRSQ